MKQQRVHPKLPAAHMVLFWFAVREESGPFEGVSATECSVPSHPRSYHQGHHLGAGLLACHSIPTVLHRPDRVPAQVAAAVQTQTAGTERSFRHCLPLL